MEASSFEMCSRNVFGLKIIVAELGFNRNGAHDQVDVAQSATVPNSRRRLWSRAVVLNRSEVSTMIAQVAEPTSQNRLLWAVCCNTDGTQGGNS